MDEYKDLGHIYSDMIDNEIEITEALDEVIERHRKMHCPGLDSNQIGTILILATAIKALLIAQTGNRDRNICDR